MAGGTNGLTHTLDHVIDPKKAVSVENADNSNLAYVTNAKVVQLISINPTKELHVWVEEMILA